jgi:hypothetical protein
MIDLSYDYNKPQHGKCECGDDECIGPAHIASVVAESLPVLQAPLLKLVKERNEARRMCELLAAAMPDLAFAVTSQKAMDAANSEMHAALMTYCKTKKDWDERSWK